MSPEPLPHTPEAFDADLLQSDGLAAVEMIPGVPMLKTAFSGTSGDVVVVSQRPAATLALLLPGQLEDSLVLADYSKEQTEGIPKQANDLLEARNSVQKQESENSQTNKTEADDFTKWVESPVKTWRAKFGKRSAGGDGPPVAPEPNMADLEALVPRQVRPVVRSKLEFFIGTDGSQTLSYEEEVVREGDVISDCGTKKRRLRSTFLDFVR